MNFNRIEIVPDKIVIFNALTYISLSKMPSMFKLHCYKKTIKATKFYSKHVFIFTSIESEMYSEY